MVSDFAVAHENKQTDKERMRIACSSRRGKGGGGTDDGEVGRTRRLNLPHVPRRGDARRVPCDPPDVVCRPGPVVTGRLGLI